MIKKIFRSVASYAIAMIFTSFIIDGFDLSFDTVTILSASVVLMLVQFILKPVIKLISFPINAVTLGFFEFLINSILLYLTAFLINGLEIEAGTLDFGYFGIVMQQIELSKLGVLIASATSISIINWLLRVVLF
ncbi:MAG: hypothetical protein QG570_323 [Patescibacteria group bacterium]|nr:hypothetical protein [Patescibacteria group bacterium]